jgi:hypothetical protein
LAQALHLPSGSRQVIDYSKPAVASNNYSHFHQGNVIVLDLSQEQINKNTTLTELLTQSGILMKPSTSKSNVAEELQLTSEPVTIGM